MKRVVLMFLLAAAAALAVDIRWYYQIEAPPRWLPGVNGTHDGIMVFVKSPAAALTVCADYYTVVDHAERRLCVIADADPTAAYQAVRLDFGSARENWSVTAISVGYGGVTKNVNVPVPGVEY